MNYLITGNLGYIGPILCEFIKTNNPDAKITGYDNGYFLNCPIAAEILVGKPFLDLQVFGDVRDKEKIRRYIQKADYIIHLAAISNDPMGLEFEKVTKEVNTESSIFIAEESIKSNSKAFVFASSCSVYGDGSDYPRSEKDELKPLTAYAKSKIETELYLRKINNYKKTKITSLRFSTACGFSPNLRLDLVLNDFVANALNNNEIEILSDGSPFRPLIDVEDMARSIFWACHRNQGNNFEILNVGSPNWNYQIKDLALGVKSTLGDQIKLKINTKALPDKRSYKVSFKKFYAMAPHEFTPKISLEESIIRMVKALTPFRERLNRKKRNHMIRLEVLKNLKSRFLIDQDLNWL